MNQLLEDRDETTIHVNKATPRAWRRRIISFYCNIKLTSTHYDSISTTTDLRRISVGIQLFAKCDKCEKKILIDT
jgi:hypothetical protein